MTALVFSALLVLQATPLTATPAPAATPVASDAAPMPVASVAPPTTFEPIVRRGPQSAPRIEATSGDAVIRNSGSTNSSGYTVVVHSDFSADVYEFGAPRHARVGTPQAKWLFAKLKEDEPFSSLGALHCMKSSSFGTTTSISFESASTPDLSCGGGDASRELMRTIDVIVNQLGVHAGFGRFRNRL